MSKSYEPQSDGHETQYEQVVNKLLEDTKTKLESQFTAMMKSYNTENNPIGIDDAKNIIKTLLEIAIVQRNLLGERLAEHIIKGEKGTFWNYLEKIKKINIIDKNLKIAKDKIERIRGKYVGMAKMLSNVEVEAYEKKFWGDVEKADLKDDNYKYDYDD